MVLELLCLVWGTCALVSLLKTDLSHSRGSWACFRVKILPLPAFCRFALRGEFLPLVVLPQLETTAMASTNCVVFSWHHQGRVECLFLELSASHNIHFLRVTRGGRLAWGSVGTWHAFSTPNGPRLCLRSFSCCLGARLRDLTFDVDPRDPRRMIDGTGRVLYYKGNLRMQYTVPNPHRRLQAITAEDDEWIVL